jgi:sulfite exporter TauE/SafE
VSLALLGILLASLLGSLHCVGMCGGFAVAVAGTGEQRWVGQAAYHGTRGLAYLVLGTLGGLLGAGLGEATAFVGLQRVAGPVMGVSLIVVAAGTSWLHLRSRNKLVSLRVPRAEGPIDRALSRIQASFSTQIAKRGVLGSAAAGAMTAFLPCGWLWSHLLAAAATQSLFGGMLVMAVFWLGTLPALFAIGMLARLLGERMGKVAPVLATIALVGVGLLALFGKLQMSPGTSADEPCHVPAEVGTR